MRKFRKCNVQGLSSLSLPIPKREVDSRSYIFKLTLIAGMAGWDFSELLSVWLVRVPTEDLEC
jgi:hypothetical protein